MQITCFALQVTPLAGGMFVARESAVLDKLLGGREPPPGALATHSDILAHAAAANGGSSGGQAGESFPTLTQLLQQFASLAREAGVLQPDMPLDRTRRDIQQAWRCNTENRCMRVRAQRTWLWLTCQETQALGGLTGM